MSENEVAVESTVSFKVTDLFRLYKGAYELVHAEDTPDLEAPVKFLTNTGDEFLVTKMTLEVNPETAEQFVFLEGVIDE